MDLTQEIKGPKNKKQIGRIGKGDKIYIEDYAVTYLNQIARSPGTENGYAGLFGHCRIVDGKKEYYIYSAIYQECEKTKDGGMPREAVQKIMRRRGENFAEHFFLGWALIFKNDSGAMWESCYRSRMETLMGKPEVLMTLKCNTCEEHFYLYPTEMPKEAEGYFIFYEQNDAMQNYLISWHGENHKDKCDDEMDNVAESCRNYYKEKKSRRLRTRVAGVLFAAAVLLLIFSAGVGVQNLNKFDKIEEVGQTLEEMQIFEESAAEKEPLLIELESQSEMRQDAVMQGTDVITQETDVVMQESVELTEVSLEQNIENVVEADEENLVTQSEEAVAGQVEEVAEEQVEEFVVETVEETGGEYITYEVAKGDTLYGICVRFYGNLYRAGEICELNHIKDMDNILYGQKILLPQ